MEFEQKNTGLIKQFREGIEPLILQAGYDLYDMDYFSNSHESKLRVFIKNKKNETETNLIEIDDCVKVDNELTTFFEQSDWIPENINLEVSSPGIFANLNQLKHFEWAIGKRVKFNLNIDINEVVANFSKKNLKDVIGELVNVNKENIEVLLESTDTVLALKFESIKKANLEPNI